MYAFEQDVPIDADVYGRIIDGLGDEAPHGLLAHFALERADGHVSYFDLWDSRADCDAFTEQRLHPVVGPALHAAGIRPDGEPPRREATILDVWGNGLPSRAAVRSGA